MSKGPAEAETPAPLDTTVAFLGVADPSEPALSTLWQCDFGETIQTISSVPFLRLRVCESWEKLFERFVYE